MLVSTLYPLVHQGLSQRRLLTLKIKQPVILPAKCIYSGRVEELQVGICRLWQNHRQIKERNITLYRKRRKLGGTASNKNPLEESESSG